MPKCVTCHGPVSDQGFTLAPPDWPVVYSTADGEGWTVAELAEALFKLPSVLPELELEPNLRGGRS